MLERVANAVLFQIGWLICVLGGNSLWLLLALAVLVIHLRWISSWAAEGRLILCVVIVGTAVDSVLRYLDVFRFADASPLIPLWLMLLWALLATTLRHCLAWSARPWWTTRRWSRPETHRAPAPRIPPPGGAGPAQRSGRRRQRPRSPPVCGPRLANQQPGELAAAARSWSQPSCFKKVALSITSATEPMSASAAWCAASLKAAQPSDNTMAW